MEYLPIGIQHLVSQAELMYEKPVVVFEDRPNPIRVVVGSGGVFQRGWIPTDKFNLDLGASDGWNIYFEEKKIDMILSEHVWEHFDFDQGRVAASICYKFLENGGRMRVAVPDGNHPSEDYISWVMPGGIGPGAEDHKVLYTFESLKTVFEDVGFEIALLEYYDYDKVFYKNEWWPEHGLVTRSAMYDPRNVHGQISYTSIILDAFKNE